MCTRRCLSIYLVALTTGLDNSKAKLYLDEADRAKDVTRFPEGLREDGEREVSLAEDRETKTTFWDWGKEWQPEEMKVFKIPPKLFLTAKYESEDAAPRDIRENVQKLRSLNPDLEVVWYGNHKCEELMKSFADPRFEQRFESLSSGMYKSDLCRAAYLYRNGGFYSDLDVAMEKPFQELVTPETSFMAAHEAGNATNLLNALMGTAPNHPILQRTLQYMMLPARELSRFHEVGFDGLSLVEVGEGSAKSMRSNQWGPTTLGQGLGDYMQHCNHARPAWNFAETRACGSVIRMYSEVDMRMPPPPGLPSSLADSAFTQKRRTSPAEGLKYGLFFVAKDNSYLVGYSRFENCAGWMCGSQ